MEFVKILFFMPLSLRDPETRIYCTTNDAFWLAKHYPMFEKDELDYILPRLEKTGLVKELVGSFIGYGGGTYNPTPLFDQFIGYIERNE